MQASKRLPLFLISLTITVTKVAWAYPEYRVTVVGPANSAAADINNTGVVVGNYQFSRGVTHGFLNRGRGLVDLGPLRGAASDARAINDKGEVLGNWFTRSGQQRGYLYRHGRQHDVGIIPGMGTIHIDINNAGYILAQGYPADPFQPRPRSFLRAPSGPFKDIGTLRYNNPLAEAKALNHRNQITGASGEHFFGDPPVRAFIWSRGVMRDLGDLGFAPNYGLAINDCGQITGFASQPTGGHDMVAFLYRNGRMIDIDGRPPVDGRFSQGRGINNYGHIVGISNHLSGFVYRGRRMESLNALIDSKLGWNILNPEAINDAGQIAATARRNDVAYAVRLDLIRPSALSAPPMALADDDAAATGGGPDADAPAVGQTDAQARARPTAQ